MAPAHRLAAERRLLGPLPRARFETAYRQACRVHPRLALVDWDATPYSVPPECLGQAVECRVEVGSEVLEVRWGLSGGGPPPPGRSGPARCVGPPPTAPPPRPKRWAGLGGPTSAWCPNRLRPRLATEAKEAGRSHVEYLAKVMAEQAAPP